MLRINPLRRATAVALTVVGTVAVPLVGAPSAAAQADGNLGVLTLNVGGIGDQAGVTWEARAARVADWAQRNQVVPDIIALQEVYGWLWTPPVRSCGRGFGINAGDYDQIDILLKALADRTGVVYRIAYLTGKAATFGDVACHVYHAQSVLYNSARIVNLTAQAGAAQPHDAVDNLHGIPHLRRSLPLCGRGTNLMPLQDLIDGPPQTDKCGRATPSGPAWAVLRDQGHIAGSFVRLAFSENPSKTIDVFNIHPTSEREQVDKPLIARLLWSVPAPRAEGRAYYYPPLMLGDFNSLAIEEFPGFMTVHVPPPPPDPNDADPIAAGIGRTESFPAQYLMRVAQRLVLPELPAGTFCPGSADILVSDHCGLFTRFEWDGPDAGALRAVFVDGPRTVTMGEPYQLAAIPAGGGPALTYRWQPGDVATPQLDARAGAPGTTQDWNVVVTDTQAGRSVSEHYSVASRPNTEACRAACAVERDTCMADVSEPGGPRPQQCVAQFQACLNACGEP